MSVNMVVGENFPRGFWILDGTSPFKDHSGYERPASLSGTAVFGHSLAKGASRSVVVKNSATLSFPTPVFIRGKEYLPFTLEVFVRPVFSDRNTISEQQVLGRSGAMDGLVINGTKVSFVTKYTNTGESRAEFDMLHAQNMHLVGVHTPTKNSLYINGDLVAESDITAAQQGDTYSSAGGLSSGLSASPNSLMLNCAAIYDSILDEEAVLTHYAHAQDTLPSQDVATDYRGQLLEFVPGGQFAPQSQAVYSSDDEWDLGGKQNIFVSDGMLLPTEDADGVSLPGHWETVIPLSGAGVFYAANLLWTGAGVVVETSLDGQVWTAAENGYNVSTLSSGTSLEGLFLYIRVSFPGGLEDDQSYLQDLTFSLYMSEAPRMFAGREVELLNASVEEDHDPMALHENWGLELRAGSVRIKSPVNNMGLIPKTIEMWVRKEGTFSDSLVSATGLTRWRSNGGAQSNYRQGEWQLRHYVFNDGFSGDIVISGTGQVGQVVLYAESLSDAVIKEIYDSYVGKPKMALSTSETFDIHEFPGAVDIYEYEWAIESAG